jgi:Ca2+-dependent lipid-binding protein
MGGMKLVVRLIEARNLPPTDPNGLRDPYAKLQLGKQKFKTKVVKKNLNPSWGEEFSFKVEDLNEELVVGVLDEDKYFNDDIVGQIKVPVSHVFDADNQSLGTVWYSLQPKNKKSRFKECGMLIPCKPNACLLLFCQFCALVRVTFLNVYDL